MDLLVALMLTYEGSLISQIISMQEDEAFPS